MKMKIATPEVCLLLAAAVRSFAGESCIAVDSDYISLTELQSAVRQSLGTVAEGELGHRTLGTHAPPLHSPTPGTRRVINVATILAALDLNSDHLSSASKAAEVCFERRQSAIPAESVLAAMQKALAPRVIRIKLIGMQPSHAPPGEVVMQAGSIEPARNGKPGQANWRGKLVYGEGQSVPLVATVEMQADGFVAVAAVDLLPDQPIGAADIEIRERTSVSFTELNRVRNRDGGWFGDGTLTEFQARFIGKAPRVMIRRGAVINVSVLTTPVLIRQNEIVEVEAIGGAVQLKWKGLAKANARLGESFAVQSWSSGTFGERVSPSRLVKATAVGPGRATVDTSRRDNNGGSSGW